jgi:magnesium-transporting ATPase (P-type)
LVVVFRGRVACSRGRRPVFSALLCVLVAVFFTPPCEFPSSSQVLYVNLVTAITMGMALAAEPAEPDAMLKPPRR